MTLTPALMVAATRLCASWGQDQNGADTDIRRAAHQHENMTHTKPLGARLS